MNKRRLLKLADLLEADAKNKKGIKFDLMYVGKRINEAGMVSGFKPGDTVELDCGTAACAVGLACISGAFKRSGLSYSIARNGEVNPIFGRSRGWGRAETAFFGLSDKESHFLFTPWAYMPLPTKGADGERLVAKRIRDFVAGKVGPSSGSRISDDR